MGMAILPTLLTMTLGKEQSSLYTAGHSAWRMAGAMLSFLSLSPQLSITAGAVPALAQPGLTAHADSTTRPQAGGFSVPQFPHWKGGDSSCHKNKMRSNKAPGPQQGESVRQPRRRGLAALSSSVLLLASPHGPVATDHEDTEDCPQRGRHVGSACAAPGHSPAVVKGFSSGVGGVSEGAERRHGASRSLCLLICEWG